MIDSLSFMCTGKTKFILGFRYDNAFYQGMPNGHPHWRLTCLLVHIKAIYAEMRGAYDWPSKWRTLLGRGIRVGKDRVQELVSARSKHGQSNQIDAWFTRFIKPSALSFRSL